MKLNHPIQPRRAALIVALAGFASLAGAYGSQHLAGLAPCPLCLYQRPPHWIAAFLASIAFFIPFAGARGLLLATAALALGLGAGIAVFHSGVEQFWWGGLAGCSGPADVAEEIDEIVRILQGRELGRCDEVPWTLFGLSMANYNAVASTGLALLAAMGAWATFKLSKPRKEGI